MSEVDSVVMRRVPLAQLAGSRARVTHRAVVRCLRCSSYIIKQAFTRSPGEEYR